MSLGRFMSDTLAGGLTPEPATLKAVSAVPPEMLVQAIGELQGLANHLERTGAQITATQLRLVLAAATLWRYRGDEALLLREMCDWLDEGEDREVFLHSANANFTTAGQDHVVAVSPDSLAVHLGYGRTRREAFEGAIKRFGETDEGQTATVP